MICRLSVALLLIGMLALPLAGESQQSAKVYRIGYLSQGSPPTSDEDRRIFGAFAAGLREFGYIEGQNVTMDRRYASGDDRRLPALAADLVRLKPDIIVTLATPPTEAVSRATKDIPVVGIAIGDPVGTGLVRSLARPGGNVTGLAGMTPELATKWLEILKALAPKLTHVTVLWFRDNPVHARYTHEAEGAARALGLALNTVDFSLSDLETIIPRTTRPQESALLVLPEARFWLHRHRLAELAQRHQIPAITMFREFADAGFLIAYGPNVADLFRRAGGYIGRILKGANPGDLPMEQPVKFDFVVNLKTAKALSLTIPQSVLLRADEVLQ